MFWLDVMARHYIVQRRAISTTERAVRPQSSWKLPHLSRQRLAGLGTRSILRASGIFRTAGVVTWLGIYGTAISAGTARKQGWQMNEISISSISDGIGLGGMLTEQTLALATEYGLNFLAALITIIIGIWAARRFSTLVRDWLNKSSRIDRTLAPILAALVKYAILTLTVVVTLGNFGVETTSIIAVLGAAGLAIGLALQGTLSNVAAGLMLLFLRPFLPLSSASGRRGVSAALCVTG